MTHPDARLIETFYGAFSRRDAEAMSRCYHPDVHFHDPAFGDLHGEEARDMWRMLCQRAEDLRVTHEVLEATGEAAEARWEAWYTFSQTGRSVHNQVHARFHFRDGLIVKHRDSFSFWRWSRQALGLPGLLLGWSPPLRTAVRKKARAGLHEFRSSPRS